ncbi:MAG TPA: helix-turn-helix domain-containing protein [Acidimicrobiales bacterium]
MAVLELLARHPDERFTLSEVARRCSLNKATAHALLSTLSERGVLLRHPDEKRYSLGPRLVAIGDAARRGYTAIDFAPTVLDGLAAATGLQASAWQMAGDHVVCVMRVGGSTNDRGSAIPLRVPLVPPVGLVFMAWSDPATVEAWLARAGAVETVGLAVEALPAIRRQGFGVMEGSPEWHTLTRSNGPRSADTASSAAQRALLRAVAHQPLVVGSPRDDHAYHAADVTAPVFGSDGEVALGVTVSGVADGGPVDGADLRALGQRVVAAADALTAAVSGRRPELAS